MESSSNDSFLWSDASIDSIECRNIKNTKTTDTKHKGKSFSGTDCDQTGIVMCESSNENETHLKRKKRKRECSDAIKEESDYSQPEEKRIKLEPESDIDVGKKRKKRNEKHIHKDSQHSIIEDEEYLNLRVKQEQSSFIQTKKEKRKRNNSNTENAYESNSALEKSTGSYLDMRVKQEQASVIEPKNVESKKKKKLKKSILSSDIDTLCETESVMESIETTVPEDSFAQTKYFVVEEKFSAEETIVEKPKKKTHKKDAVIKHNYDSDNDSKQVTKKTNMVSEVNSDIINNIDLSIEPSDFTCNNIISSTIINNSAMENIDNKPIKKKKALRRNENVHTVKISDRIKFEDDNSSQQSTLGETSANINLFLKANPHLKLCSRETPKESIITKDDEIWTLTWSHEIDLNKLKNSTVLSEGKSKVKIDGQTYDGIPNEDEESITLLTYKHGQPCITNFPIKLCMNYQTRIPKVHIPDNNIMINNQTNFIPLPETKCRHPLFGAHYKKAIKISSAVKERLQAAKVPFNETPFESNSKKKYKKVKQKLLEIKVEEDYVSVKQDCEPLKKKKKRKQSQSDYTPSKKPKYIKQDADSATVWESEKAIEENLFNF